MAGSSTDLWAFNDDEAREWNEDIERAEQRAAFRANAIEQIAEKGLLAKLVMPEDVVIWEARHAHLPEALNRVLWEQGQKLDMDHGGGVQKKVRRVKLHRGPDERMSNFIRRLDEADRRTLEADRSIPRTPPASEPGLKCPPTASTSRSPLLASSE